MKLIPAATLPFSRENESSVYCATFQMAYDQLCHYLGSMNLFPVHTPNGAIDALNRGRGFDLRSFADSEYIARAGTLPSIVYQIYEEMEKKFGKRVVELPTEGDVLAFAYLLKLLQFKIPFTKYVEPSNTIIFKETPVESFGYRGHNFNRVNCYSYTMYGEDTKTVEIDLGDDLLCFTKSNVLIPTAEEVIVVSRSLRTPQNRTWFVGNVRIPILNFEVLQDFPEVCVPLLNQAGSSITSAKQYVKFGLDEKGVSLESYSIIGYSGSAGPSIAPIDFLFNTTFYVELVSKRTNMSYFVAKIDSTEGMNKL
jgi:hypothetical protein